MEQEIDRLVTGLLVTGALRAEVERTDAAWEELRGQLAGSSGWADTSEEGRAAVREAFKVGYLSGLLAMSRRLT